MFLLKHLRCFKTIRMYFNLDLSIKVMALSFTLFCRCCEDSIFETFQSFLSTITPSNFVFSLGAILDQMVNSIARFGHEVLSKQRWTGWMETTIR